MPGLVYIDGTLCPKEEAKISVFDHGLLYGDGVFEGIRAYHGTVFRLEEHTERLFQSAEAIALKIPLSPGEFADAVRSTLEANKLEDAYIRAIVTRGVGTLGLDPNKCPSPSVIIIVDTIALYPEELYQRGLSIITAATMQKHPQTVSPRIKSLNYLNNILAKIEAINSGVMEAILINHEGCVTEGTTDNVFVVRDGAVMTPPPSAGILLGITRQVVLDIARDDGITVTEENMTRFDLLVADECFLTGTAAEIISVIRIDGRTIGDDKPGPVTAKLLARFRELVRST